MDMDELVDCPLCGGEGFFEGEFASTQLQIPSVVNPCTCNSGQLTRFAAAESKVYAFLIVHSHSLIQKRIKLCDKDAESRWALQAAEAGLSIENFTRREVENVFRRFVRITNRHLCQTEKYRLGEVIDSVDNPLRTFLLKKIDLSLDPSL